MAYLIYPHLCLFTYVLRDETKAGDVRLEFQEKQGTDRVSGTVYRYELGDTEQWLITSAIEQKQEPRSLDQIKGLKEKVLAQWQNTAGSKVSRDRKLGRSWLVFGVLPIGEDPQMVVRSVCQSLGLEERVSNFVDEWKGAKVFEIDQAPQTLQDWTEIGEFDQHGVVALYSDLVEMEQGVGEALLDWLVLLQYRHKASWAYANTKRIKFSLSQRAFSSKRTSSFHMRSIMQNQEISELNLQTLTQELKETYTLLFDYTEGLTFLDFQLETLKINLKNYQSRLETMATKEIGLRSYSFQGLQQFEERTGKRYARQVERDIETLTLGFQLWEKTTDTIRGFVELEQAERDRRLEAQSKKFQDSIAVLGVGLGSAAIAASFAAAKLEDASIVQSAAKIVPVPMRIVSSPWLEGAIGVGLCSAIGILMAVLISLGLSLGKSRKFK